MKASAGSVALGAVIAALSVTAAPVGEEEKKKRDVDTRYPYLGPDIPIADWVDYTVNGNGKGFIRLVEPPAVKPTSNNPTNNVNVIALAYIPNGMNIHFQTPFGLGSDPVVQYGTNKKKLTTTATGVTDTYDRTPPCSLAQVQQCSQFFHNVQLTNLLPETTYYYKILPGNGTVASPVLSFTTSRPAGTGGPFTVSVLNDMGYTNAGGTVSMMQKAVKSGSKFAWHGGDISYADDWYSGILACEADWDVCYNGTSSSLPFGITKEYKTPLPAGEIPDQGGPNGGDVNVLYETNWDIWQQWMNAVTMKIPYMTLPGNHEAACAEFDGPGNILTAYLNNNETNSTAAASDLNYYSCPPSQRNFTAYQHRFRMPGPESGGVGNFWYSFDYGLAHFISFSGETDFAYSPEWPFLRDTGGASAFPTEDETYITDSGPFGYIEGGGANVYNTTAYEQYQWMKADLAAVNRTLTPWVIAMSHRPMYSSQTSSYQKNMRNAWEKLFISNGVDLYLSGHIHWYERLFPIAPTSVVDSSSIVDSNTYYTNPGVSMTHIINGMAGNIESHSTLGTRPILNITHTLNQQVYGFSSMTIVNETMLKWNYIKGDGTGVGDALTLLKRPAGM